MKFLAMIFPFLRIIIAGLTLLSQIYLFLWARQLIRGWHRTDHFKSRFIRLVGLAISLLFVMSLYLAFRPVPWMELPPAIQIILFYLPAVWSFGAIFSALLLGCMQTAGWLVRMAVRLYRSLTSQEAAQHGNLSRRHFLQAAAGGIVAAPLILSGYGVAHADTTCKIREFTLPFGRPLRVAQLSDIHAGIYMTPGQIRRYIERISAFQPDLFLLTGDFISNSLIFLPGCLAEIARVRPRYGTFASPGNHEHWYGDLSEIQTVFRQHQILLLRNSHQVVQTEHGPFAVAGIEDLTAGHPDLEAALHGLNADVPTILLSHHPEIFPEAAAQGIPLTLAGHYHGGQIKLNLTRKGFSLANFLTAYPEGLYRIKASHLYVSRGIGTTFTPVRLNVPPEITLLHLV
jgi:uncharacterized protein